MNLATILLQTNSDKQARHGYGDIYDPIFTPFRLRPVRILEIGIDGGGSLLAWAKYFTHKDTRIIGVDIHDRGFLSPDPRIETIYGDASQPDFLRHLPGPFDIIIEDGSHLASHQITAWEWLWLQLAPGGVYCCEDLHVVHSPQHRDMHIDFLDYVNRLAHEMQDTAGAHGSALPSPRDKWHSIESIALHKGVAVFKKRP